MSIDDQRQGNEVEAEAGADTADAARQANAEPPIDAPPAARRSHQAAKTPAYAGAPWARSR